MIRPTRKRQDRHRSKQPVEHRSALVLVLTLVTATCGSLPGVSERAPEQSTTSSAAPRTTPGPDTTTAPDTTTTPDTTSAPDTNAASDTTSAPGSTLASDTTITPSTTAGEAATTTVVNVGTTAELNEQTQTVAIRFESQVGDVSSVELRDEALVVLNDPRGWIRAGFTFIADDSSELRVVLAEGLEVDQLCLPLKTGGTVSCQNGPVVALNADRWRTGVPHWDGELADYRGYLVNHEVGHLIGQRHPTPRCPVPGRPAGVMEQQTGSLKGCTGNAWPRDWEIAHATQRPVVYAPLPDWAPDPVPANNE